eukprot:m.114042 g.114042  ORF g.114042 m.114042 type:complete len:1372 (+) comp28322_c0_seq1:106-4221(+)
MGGNSRGDSPTGEDDCIKVFIRMRPLGGGSGEHQEVARCVKDTTDTTIALGGKEERNFTFDGIKGEDSTQDEMFSMVGRGVVENCIDGYNGTIFAYGQTGSGKTYTMAGPLDDAGNILREKRGLMPRCFEQIFSLINRKQQQHGDKIKHLVTCSFLEIYNEKIFDLLDAGSVGLVIREDVKSGVTVRDLTDHPCNNANEACEILRTGNRNRRVASTSMNRESSRSHAVFQMTIKSLTVSGAVTNVKEAKLNLIDLAGSERQRDTKADGSRLKEAGSINKSLSALGNVIMSLVDIANGKHRHVAYRDSKLTFLLRDSLGGNTKTYMVANVSPASRCFGETLSTLQFAQRAKMIKNRAKINEETSGCVSSLREEIKKLKLALSQGGGKISSEPSSNAGSTNDDSANLLMAAINNRKLAELEKDAIRKELVLVKQLVSKKEKALQSTKMILRFRDAALSKMSSKNNATTSDAPQEIKDKIKALEDEIKTQKEMVAHHPEVTRFAMQNLQLKEQVDKFNSAYPEASTENKLLKESREYTLLLEARLLALQEGNYDMENMAPGAFPATPVARRTRSKAVTTPMMPETPRAKRSRELELENFKMEKEHQVEIEALKEALVIDQKLTEETIKAGRSRELELCGELDGAVARLNELENSLKVLRVRHKMELTRLQEEQMKRLEKFGNDTSEKENQRFQAQLDMITSELNAMKNENASLKREQDNFAEIKSDLITEVATANSQLNSMMTQAEQSYRELEQFKEMNKTTVTKKDAEYATLQQQLRQARDQLADVEEKLMEMTEMYEDSKSNFEKLSQKVESDKDKFDSDIAEMTNQVQMLQSEFDNERTQRMNFEAEVSNLSAEVDFKDDELEKKTIELEQTMKTVAELEKTKSSLSMQLEEIKERNLDTSIVGEDEEKQIEVLSNERDELLASVTSSQAVIENLRRELENEQTMRKETHEGMEGMQRLLEDKSICLESQLELNRKEKIEHEAVTEVYESKLAELIECKESMGQLSEQAITDSETISSLTNVIESLKTELDSEAIEHQQQVRELMTELSSTHDRARDATDKHKKAVAEIEKLTSDVAGLKLVHTSLQARAEKETKSSQSLLTEVAMLRKQAAEYVSVKQQLGTTHEAHINDINLLKTQLKDASSVLESTETIKNQKIQELHDVKNAVADLKEKLSLAENFESSLQSEQEARKIEQEAAQAEINDLQQRMKQTEQDHLAIIESKQNSETEMKIVIDKLSNEKVSLESRYNMCEVNLDAALEDAEALVEELQRAQTMEQTLYKEKEELKSKYEQSQEAKLRVEEDHAKLKHKLTDLQAETDKLVGHQNTGQKIQLHLQIKKENNALKNDILKLKQQLSKSSANVERKVLSTVN